MSGFIYKNNVESLLNGILAIDASTLPVTAGDGTKFPSTFPFRLTIWNKSIYSNPGNDTGMEIVHCTGRTGDNLTIVRAQEGTSASAHTSGETVAMLITAGHFNDATYGIQTILDGKANSAHEQDASTVNFEVIGTPTHHNAQHWFNIVQSSGIIDGFIISAGVDATHVNVSAGKGIIKTTDSEIGTTVSFEVEATTGLLLTALSMNYIYVDYNVGNPIVKATTNRNAIGINTMFPIGRVYSNTTGTHIASYGVHVPNLTRTEHERLIERDIFTYISGSVASKIATLDLGVTSGVWYFGHNRLTTPALNTSGTDTFTYIHYNDAGAAWVIDDASASAIDTTKYNAGTAVLGTMSSNSYSVQWLYVTADGYYYIKYGYENGNLAAAQEAIPSGITHPYLDVMGELIAKIIVKSTSNTIISIQDAHVHEFAASTVANHNELGGIQGGAANDYHHLTLDQQTVATQAATAAQNGLATSTQITKLDGIATNANNYVHPNHSGAVTSTGDGATVITDKAVTLAKMADMATASLIGRNTAEIGVPEVLSKATALSLLNVADGANNYVHPNHTGDVTSVADGVQTIAANAVTNAKLSQIATATIKGRVTAATGNVEDLTAANVRTIINVADGANAYVHPNHTGDVTSTGDGATVIGASKIKDTMVDWGTGATQVSAVDIPIADAGAIITAVNVEAALQENRTAINLNTAKETNVTTNLSEGTATVTTVDVNSSDGTNATLVSASATRAGLLTKAKFDEIVANTAKVTNATHTGDVTGATSLTVNKTAITGKTAVTAVGTDYVLISDASDTGNLKKAFVSDIYNTAYGLSWDESADTYARTGTLAGQPLNVSPVNALIPIQASMKRCLLKDNGTINYFINGYNRDDVAPFEIGTDDVGTANKVSDVGVFTLAAADYVGRYIHNTTDDTYALITAKDSDNVLSLDANIMALGETFEICTAHLGAGVAGIDNPQGQVMVQIPKFYYKYGYAGTSHTWEISPIIAGGFTVHPAFIKNGVEVDYRYMGAYEGSMYDASAGAMVAPADITANLYAAGDKLCSLSGEYPKTNETRAEFRGMAAQRGIEWLQQYYSLKSAIQLLYVIEYGSFYSQSVIGAGRTQLSGGTWTAGSYIGMCGKSNINGNGTGNIGGNTDAAYMSYRGIENFYGNVWKWVDGININNNVPYISNTGTDFADDTATNYTNLGVTLVATDGYQNTLQQISNGFLPASVGATSTTKITDYYWQSTGWRVFLLGGNAGRGAAAGAFSAAAYCASSFVSVDVGSRLSY